MTTYQFHTKLVNHYFCPTCGVSLFCTGVGGAIVLNVPTIDGLDLKMLKVKEFDGAKLL